jgi:precorrin-6B methylase 2
MNLLSAIKRPVAWLLQSLDLYSLYSLRRTGPLLEDGWFRSYREQASVDASGAPLPWITYPAIEFLRKRIKPDFAVFEYGAGASTIWWAKQVRIVVSVEHDRSWLEKLNLQKYPNVTAYQIDLVPGGAYSKKIQEFENTFDVVVIDGRDRTNCTKNCLNALKPSGVVIFDNSEYPEFFEALNFLLNNGFRKIEFVGFCPIVNLKSETAIFYREQNVFGI